MTPEIAALLRRADEWTVAEIQAFPRGALDALRELQRVIRQLHANG